MSWLAFLAHPWFVIPWYAVGILGFVFVVIDEVKWNTALKPAMKWAWPIITLFFSLIGLGLYFTTARAPRIGRRATPEAKHAAHAAFEQNVFRRVNGAVIHCVAGDGLGIMTAMVIARMTSMTFWQEFWFEYALGFAFGWFIFQRKSMSMMTDDRAQALWMAFRAEFFSMLAVMGGMGAVMTFVTPSVVGLQPRPTTYAFWGFAMLGLLAGYGLTFPMNWMMVKLGWKHGMGDARDGRPAHRPAGRAALAIGMSAFGAAALVLPAWLTAVRERRAPPMAASTSEALLPSMEAMQRGLRDSLEAARRAAEARQDSALAVALDSSLRGAEVLSTAAPDGGRAVLDGVRAARRSLQLGRRDRVAERVRAAEAGLEALHASVPRRSAPLGRYPGAKLVNARGVLIGEVGLINGDRIALAIGGPRDVWGFLDLGGHRREVAIDDLIFGPRRTIGRSYVMLPTVDVPR